METNWGQLWIDARKDSVLAKYRKDVGVELWDRGAEEYSDTIKRDGFKYGEQMVDALKSIIKPDFEVLDNGCGPGTLAVPLAKPVDRVVALDPPKRMLEVLEESAVMWWEK